MNLFLEILRLSMYATGIARNLYAIWREYKQQRIAKGVIEKGRLQPALDDNTCVARVSEV